MENKITFYGLFTLATWQMGSGSNQELGNVPRVYIYMTASRCFV